MYSVQIKSGFVAVLLMFLVSISYAQTTVPTKERFSKRGRACKSLRLMTRQKPELRERVQRVLFQQREAEKVCREAFQNLLPGLKPTPKGGSVCNALRQYRHESEDIKVALRRARLLERRSHARCLRLLKQLKTEVPKRKAAGMR